MVKFFVVLVLIYINQAEADKLNLPTKIYTEHSFESHVECRHFIFSDEYQAALIDEFRGRGIIQVIPGCERRFTKEEEKYET